MKSSDPTEGAASQWATVVEKVLSADYGWGNFFEWEFDQEFDQDYGGSPSTVERNTGDSTNATEYCVLYTQVQVCNGSWYCGSLNQDSTTPTVQQAIPNDWLESYNCCLIGVPTASENLLTTNILIWEPLMNTTMWSTAAEGTPDTCLSAYYNGSGQWSPILTQDHQWYSYIEEIWHNPAVTFDYDMTGNITACYGYEIICPNDSASKISFPRYMDLMLGMTAFHEYRTPTIYIGASDYSFGSGDSATGDSSYDDVSHRFTGDTRGSDAAHSIWLWSNYERGKIKRKFLLGKANAGNDVIVDGTTPDFIWKVFDSLVESTFEWETESYQKNEFQRVRTPNKLTARNFSALGGGMIQGQDRAFDVALAEGLGGGGYDLSLGLDIAQASLDVYNR